ncbi:allantoate deiminase [Peribacillus faecalis]|nr:allantoate deiminase [Peribacillus faecalis]
MAMRIKKESASEMIEWLASYGKTKEDGVTRLLYSPTWVEAQHALKGKMEKTGLQAYFDCVGNLFGRLPGSDSDSNTILTGSHIDTVVEGGKYDGAYGIIASLLAVENLIKLYGTPKKTIEVVSFCEEEGSRFPITFWGSRNITNLYSLEDAAYLTDCDGIPLLQAMREAGFDDALYSPPARSDIEAFIEVHIEQGIVLERNKKSIGIVSHIVGQRRFNITINGESNHAGTTPMAYRKDAVALAADFIHFTTNLANEETDLVATFGKLIAKPNVPNVIADEVQLSLDIRHYDDVQLDQFCEHIFSYLKEKTSNSDFQVTVTKWMDVKPIAMNEDINHHIEDITERNRIPYQYIVSGAGHDSQVFGSVCPTALLFVPSVAGFSHSPKEYTKLEDLETGIDVLTELLYKLAY